MFTWTDAGKTLDDFAEVMYVCCPKCRKRAQVRRIVVDNEKDQPGAGHRLFSSRRFSCLHCGHTRIWEKNTIVRSREYDWYFGLPLWLQTPCCGEVLWALNEEHLLFLERYIAAKQRLKFPAGGLSRNRTMASRLPGWMKSAKNRDEVLKGIARLKKLWETTELHG